MKIFPILDDNVKSLEDYSSVTNDTTMIYQASEAFFSNLEYHCGIIGLKYEKVSDIG